MAIVKTDLEDSQKAGPNPALTQPETTDPDLSVRGEEIYERLREALERTSPHGVVAIDVVSGEHFVGRDVAEADTMALRAHPGKRFYFRDIGNWAAPASLVAGENENRR